MSTPTWPTFSGHDGAPKVDVIGGKTQVFTSEAGTKWPLGIWDAGRYRFTFGYAGLRTDKMAPAPYGSQSEAACAVNLILTLKGGFGLVYVVNPLDGQTYLCRMVADSASFEKVPKCPWYKCSVQFETV